MPLFKETFQPYFPDPDSPNPRPCGPSYCYPVADGDIIRQQWRQTPCAGNLVVDPEFDEQTDGPELVTNGDIATPTDWNPTGSWSYGAGFLNYSGNTLSATVSQGGLGLIAGNVYKVTFDVTVAAGEMTVKLGSGAGMAASDPILATGSYELFMNYGSADDTIYFEITAFATALTLDNISVVLVTYSDWDPNGSWTLTTEDGDTPAMACKNTTGTGKLINGNSGYITNGDRYIASVIVSGYTSGSVQLYIDDGTGSTSTNVQTAISENGEKTYYFDALQDGVIAFLPSSDFVGCLSFITIRRLRNDFIFELINEAGDTLDISIGATYVDDKILLNLDLSALREAGDVDYGCYTISVYDACLISGDNLVQDGNFSNGDFSEWARAAGAWQYDMSGGEITFIFEPLDDNPNLVTDGFPIAAGAWTAGAGWAFGTAWDHTPGSTATLSQTITLSAPAVSPAYLKTWYQIEITGRTAGSVTLTISDIVTTPFSSNGIFTASCDPTIGGSVTLAITPTSTFDGSINIVRVHEATRIWQTPFITNPANPAVVAGNYELSYTVTNIVGDLGNAIGGQAWIRYPSVFVPGIGLGVHTHQQLGYVPGSTFIELAGDFVENSTSYPGRVTIDNYSVVRIEPFEATFTSECIVYKESFEGSILLTAWSDQDAFGLDFTGTNYLLQMRVNCRSFNADLDDESLLAKYGDGNSRLVYGQLEKFWQFLTDDMSESALTTLAAMIRCDHFTVGELGEAADEYDATIRRFTPAWREQGDSDIAPVILELRKREGGMKFNRKT